MSSKHITKGKWLSVNRKHKYCELNNGEFCFTVHSIFQRNIPLIPIFKNFTITLIVDCSDQVGLTDCVIYFE